jgi:purine-binding chemotaxis protein CheW
LGEGVARVDMVMALAAILEPWFWFRVSALPADAGLARELQAGASALFRLAGRPYAISASAVLEILAAVAVTSFPLQPAYIAGLVDLRGTIVPVLDLRVRFGIPARPMELSDRLIVIRARERLLMLWVDDVETFAPFDFTAWNGAGGLLTGDPGLAGVVSSSDGVTTIYDVDAFVAQCEADAVFDAVHR